MQLAVILLLLQQALPSATDADCEGLWLAGREALAARSFNTASERFRRGADVCPDTSAADFAYLLGLTKQREAEDQSTTEDRRKQLWHTAIVSYELALSKGMKSAPVYNGLGVSFAAIGERASAQENFEISLKLPDDNKATHVTRYAQFVATTGDPDRAEALLQTAAGADPNRIDPRRATFEIRAAAGLQGGIGYLWLLRREKQYENTALIAADSIPRYQWSDDQRRELLNLIAVCLTTMSYAPADFAKTPIGKHLEPLEADPAIGRGVVDIEAIHSPQLLADHDFSWWSKAGPISSPGEPTIWPHQAFRTLAMELGDRFRRANDVTAAQKYFQFATWMNREQPDLTAMIKLLDLYETSGQGDVMVELVSQYDTILEPLRSQFDLDDWKALYEYRRKLMILFSLLLTRELGQPVASVAGGDKKFAEEVIAQFNSMVAAANVYNRAAAAAGISHEQSLTIEPQTLTMAADAYIRLGSLTDALSSRINAAQLYIRAKRYQTARGIIQLIKSDARTAPLLNDSTLKAVAEMESRLK